MEDLKKFMFKRQNVDKSNELYIEREPESTQIFSSWNNLDSLDNDPINNKSTSQRLYFSGDENDDDDSIPAIPDIEDLEDQDFIQQTADAPHISFNQIDNIEELDKKVSKKINFSPFGNIDLSVLSNFCLPEDKVKENDVQWSWNSLITEIMYNNDVLNLNQDSNIKSKNDNL